MNPLWTLFLLLIISCQNPQKTSEEALKQTQNKKQFSIYSRFSKNCLQAQENYLISVKCAQNSDQNFEFIKIKNFIYNIKLESKNQCLEVSDDSDADGAKIHWAPCSAKANQEILLQNSSLDPFYKRIIFIHSSKCLDLVGPKRASGTKLHQWSCHQGSSQEFLVTAKKAEPAQVPKIVWTFWDKGVDKMPGFYQANIKHWAEILGPEWKIRVVNLLPQDENYFENFIDKNSVPDIAWIKTKIGYKSFEKKLNPTVIFSDFVRLELLYQHGGVWMDPSDMLHHDLSEVVTPLEMFSNFQIAGFTSKTQATPELRYADSLENFFLAALPKSEVVKEWKTNFRTYWEGKKPGMAIEDNPLYNNAEGPLIDVSNFRELSNYLNQHVALKFTLQNNKRLLESIFILGENGAWDKGPFSLLEKANWQDGNLINLDRESIQKYRVEMRGVLISKFPSENSALLRKMNESYFFQPNNIFGQLNEMSNNEDEPSFRCTPEFPTAKSIHLTTVKSINGDLCLTVRSKNDGGTLSMQKCNGSNNQIFEEIVLDNSKSLLRSRFSCKCVDVEAQSRTTAPVHQWHCHAGRSQQLDIGLEIRFAHSDLCLDISNKNHIHQELCNHSSLQQFQTEPKTAVAANVNRQVWGFWDKGEAHLPAFNHYNVLHWRKLLEPLGYKITIANLIPGDPNNVETLLGSKDLLPQNWDTLESVVVPFQGPDGGWVKMVPSVVRSDFARLALLEKFGGIWMDTSNVLIKDLDAMIINAMNGDPKREVGGYIMDGYASENSPVVNGERVDGMENWFIAAKAHSSLIREWRLAFIKYWETKKVGQQIHTHPMYEQPGFDFGGLGISAPGYLNQHAALKYVLFKHPELGQKILPIKHMQPWWFHAKVGGSSEELYRGFVSPQISKYVREIKQDQVELLKFAGPHLTEIKQHFKTLQDYCDKPNLLKELYVECP